MTTLLVDTHALLWWSVSPDRLSRRAMREIESADEVALAAVSGWELAWLAVHERITIGPPLRTWLGDLSRAHPPDGPHHSGPRSGGCAGDPGSVPRPSEPAACITEYR